MKSSMPGPILATLCYVIRGSQVLLLERNKKKHDIHQNDGLPKFVGLGGKLEPRETPRSCVIREVREEAGLTIEPEFRGIMTFVDRRTHNHPPTQTQILIFIYTAAFPKNGQIVKDCPEGTLHWIEKDGVDGCPMWEGDYAFLKKLFFTPQILDLHHVYVDGRLTPHASMEA
jgi:8-oxo-dGTP diphosphatase